jgi:hypothetical protein
MPTKLSWPLKALFLPTATLHGANLKSMISIAHIEVVSEEYLDITDTAYRQEE